VKGHCGSIPDRRALADALLSCSLLHVLHRGQIRQSVHARGRRLSVWRVGRRHSRVVGGSKRASVEQRRGAGCAVDAPAVCVRETRRGHGGGHVLVVGGLLGVGGDGRRVRVVVKALR
jgi:hypothetical protein